MGQRSQIIILNDGGKTKAESNVRVQAVYHNQWHYGVGFLSTLHNILEVWGKGIKKLESKNELYEHTLGRLLENAVDYANVKDFPHTSGYSEITNEGFDKCKTLREVLGQCDNNNGFIVLLLNGKQLSYDIITGNEDAGENKRISAKGYLRLFYKNKEDLKSNLKEVEKMIADIQAQKRFDSDKIIIGENKLKKKAA